MKNGTMSKRSVHYFFLCFLICSSCSVGQVIDSGNTKHIQKGRYTVRFTERYPLGLPNEMTRRYGWDKYKRYGEYVYADEYTIENESFVAFVPDTYDETEPFGLIVWISPGNYGGPPNEYEETLRRYKLIWIGGNQIGNDRYFSIRLGMSLDAVYNMTKQYKIDPERIYVSGFSGGGRMSSELTMVYADVFTGGGFYQMGSNYRDDLLDPVKKGYYPGFWQSPIDSLLDMARTHRYLILTGENDFNNLNTNLVYDAYKNDGFKYSVYLEVPDIDHNVSPGEWFEQGVTQLERMLQVQKDSLDIMVPDKKFAFLDDDKRKMIPGKNIWKILSRIENESKNQDPGWIGEADQLIQSFHRWYKRTIRHIQNIKSCHPAETSMRLEVLAKTVKGLPYESEVKQLTDSLVFDKATEKLSGIYEKVWKFHRELREKGPDRNVWKEVDQLRDDVNVFLEDNPPDILTKEAKDLLEKI